MKFHQLKNNIGYWVIDDIDSIIDFDKFSKEVYVSEFVDKNPFNPFSNQKISYIPETFTVLKFLEKFYHTHVNSRTASEKNYDAWTNLYQKSKFNCMSAGLIPHIDSVNLSQGIVANMWLNENVSGSGTKLYSYSGKTVKTNYGYKLDFMVDPNHKFFDRFHRMTQEKVTKFVNNNWEDWGFTFLGMAPSQYKTMTIYKINTPHTAFVPETVDERWSASFLYEAFTPVVLG